MGNLAPWITKVGTAGALVALVRRRRKSDPVHAPGHRHRKPPPLDDKPKVVDIAPPQNQPWIRRSHSDSQQRRFRR